MCTRPGSRSLFEPPPITQPAAITGNYAGSPAVQPIACTLPTPTCTNGTLTPGAWTAAGGTATSTTATYSEAGSFNLTFQDTSFASVDAADTPATCAGYYVCSAATSVGRFVPDHFALAPSNVPNLKTFNNAACAVRSFTYIGQPFGYVTAPQALVTAQNSANVNHYELLQQPVETRHGGGRAGLYHQP